MENEFDHPFLPLSPQKYASVHHSQNKLKLRGGGESRIFEVVTVMEPPFPPAPAASKRLHVCGMVICSLGLLSVEGWTLWPPLYVASVAASTLCQAWCQCLHDSLPPPPHLSLSPLSPSPHLSLSPTSVLFSRPPPNYYYYPSSTPRPSGEHTPAVAPWQAAGWGLSLRWPSQSLAG